MANKSKFDIIFLQTDVRTFKREIVQAEDELIPEIQCKLLNIKREPVDGSVDMDVDVDADADAVNDDDQDLDAPGVANVCQVVVNDVAHCEVAGGSLQLSTYACSLVW